MRRCSILLHTAYQRPHLDIVVNNGRRCLTWSLFTCQRPLHHVAHQWYFFCKQNHDHRRRYLDYSGSIGESGKLGAQRGRVHQLWTGHLVLTKNTQDAYKLRAINFTLRCETHGLASLQFTHRLQPWLIKALHIMKIPQPQHS